MIRAHLSHNTQKMASVNCLASAHVGLHEIFKSLKGQNTKKVLCHHRPPRPPNFKDKGSLVAFEISQNFILIKKRKLFPN